MERKQASERHSLPGACRVWDQSSKVTNLTVVSSKHLLERAEVETGQDMERKQASEGHLLAETGQDTERKQGSEGNSELGSQDTKRKKASKEHSLTEVGGSQDWSGHKKSEPATGTHLLEQAGFGKKR